ncbi:hypothetical protein [Geothrix mesophila]|uniref:hypothetical protein n=1 Tax=Geothrix mesophila TaxID=2922723 RepID=UPI001FACC3E4|nr:hypothetical protein [Geothrix sp. SG198]
MDYGFDLHEISISDAAFTLIQAGQPVTLQGQGFPVEGQIEGDLWMINTIGRGFVRVVTVEGRDVFEGNIGDAEVDVRVASLNFSLRPTGDPASEVN